MRGYSPGVPGLLDQVVPQPRVKRLVWLFVGLVLFGLTLSCLVVADLGLDPWDVFHQGMSRTIDVRLGAVVVTTSFVVLLLWIPLRQRFGLGTIANAIIVGISLEAGVTILPDVESIAGRIGLLVVGIVGNAIATALYIGAGLGPGPRDGLMTGLAKRGFSLRVVRTSIEVVVLAAGWLLGGTVGIGTVAFALAIGPLIHRLLPHFLIEAEPAGRRS